MKTYRHRIANKYRFTFFLVAMILIVITLFGTMLGFNTAESIQDTQYLEVSIQSGDTLWDIAKMNSPENIDTRKVVYEIKKLNDLDNGFIYPGQVVRVPLYEAKRY